MVPIWGHEYLSAGTQTVVCPSAGTRTVMSPSQHHVNLGRLVPELDAPVLGLGSMWFGVLPSSGKGHPVPELHFIPEIPNRHTSHFSISAKTGCPHFGAGTEMGTSHFGIHGIMCLSDMKVNLSKCNLVMEYNNNLNNQSHYNLIKIYYIPSPQLLHLLMLPWHLELLFKQALKQTHLPVWQEPLLHPHPRCFSWPHLLTRMLHLSFHSSISFSKPETSLVDVDEPKVM